MKYFAIITTDFVATHKYEGDAYKTIEGNFLRWEHRHKFFVTIKIQQFHNDRDIEYLNFKGWIEDVIRNVMTKGKTSSCEMYCEDIAATIRNIEEYRGRELAVSVMEDNENGAEVHFEKDEPKTTN